MRLGKVPGNFNFRCLSLKCRVKSAMNLLITIWSAFLQYLLDLDLDLFVRITYPFMF